MTPQRPSGSAERRSPPFAGVEVEFVGSFPDPGFPLAPPGPEIAFVGRSNVGKSSLINALLGRSGLARVSGTPGKTTLINVYRLPGFYLIDLPGYGWARASKSARRAYQTLVRRYLQERERLAGVVWLLDIRRQPSPEDRAMQELLEDAGHPVLVVLTKADKLAWGARHARVREMTAALGVEEDHVLAVSSRTGFGIADLGDSVRLVGES